MENQSLSEKWMKSCPRENLEKFTIFTMAQFHHILLNHSRRKINLILNRFCYRTHVPYQFYLQLGPLSIHPNLAVYRAIDIAYLMCTYSSSTYNYHFQCQSTGQLLLANSKISHQKHDKVMELRDRINY